MGVPVETGDPNLPASVPAGTDLRPNLAEEVSFVALPDQVVEHPLGSRPQRAAGPGVERGRAPFVVRTPGTHVRER